MLGDTIRYEIGDTGPTMAPYMTVTPTPKPGTEGGECKDKDWEHGGWSGTCNPGYMCDFKTGKCVKSGSPAPGMEGGICKGRTYTGRWIGSCEKSESLYCDPNDGICKKSGFPAPGTEGAVCGPSITPCKGNLVCDKSKGKNGYGICSVPTPTGGAVTGSPIPNPTNSLGQQQIQGCIVGQCYSEGFLSGCPTNMIETGQSCNLLKDQKIKGGKCCVPKPTLFVLPTKKLTNDCQGPYQCSDYCLSRGFSFSNNATKLIYSKAINNHKYFYSDLLCSSRISDTSAGVEIECGCTKKINEILKTVNFDAILSCSQEVDINGNKISLCCDNSNNCFSVDN